MAVSGEKERKSRERMSGDTSMRKKRETYRKKSENAIYTDIREKLKTAIALNIWEKSLEQMML